MVHSSFQLKQIFLHIKAAAEAAQLTVRRNHAMTGHDDRDRVAAVRRANGSYCPRLPDALRDTRVAARLSVRNRFELAPDAPLELGAFGRERDLELAQFATEIGAKLSHGLGHHRVRGV